jgi:hypothetical protein
MASGAQRSKLPLILIDKDNLAPNRAQHGLEGIWVGFAAEDKDLVTRLAGLLARVELVTVCVQWE